MNKLFIYLIVLFFLLSGCAPVEDTAELEGETAEAAASLESPPTQMETAAPTDTRLAPTEAATPTISPPDPVETATQTESQPTPVVPFTAESIGPGQQEAYTFQTSTGEEIIFWLYLPEDYDESQKWPLMLALHGFLGFEPSLEKVRGQSPLAWLDPDVEFPFIVIAPQAPSGSWAKYHLPMNELIEFLSASLSIDPDAQFLTGLSAGAVGAWQWALAYPDRFAGVAPIAGGPSMNPNDPVPENICLLKELPVWVAHSEVDRDAAIESNRAMVMALEGCGSTVASFTVYTDFSHMDSIRKAYTGPELYDWMLALMQ
jgi:predicted peptidase